MIIYIYMYVCMYVCMYVYIYIYIYIVYTSRFVRVILAQGPCKSSLHRSNFNG